MASNKTTQILELQKTITQDKHQPIKKASFLFQKAEAHNSSHISNNQGLECQPAVQHKEFLKRPSKALLSKEQNTQVFPSNKKIDLQKRFLVENVQTDTQQQAPKTNKVCNNFLLSPGALQRSESTLSMSLISRKNQPFLLKSSCEKIQEEEEGKEAQNDQKQTIQQLHCLKNMLTKKQNIRAPPSLKNKCQNCHIMNMTIFQKANPKKKLNLENQKQFEKLIDEQVFSDDEGDDYIEVNETMTYSIKNTSFSTNNDQMSVCSSRVMKQRSKSSVVCPNCQSRKTSPIRPKDQLIFIDKTAGSGTSDSVKRIGSKRGFQESFLIMPKGKKVEIEKSNEKTCEPGSHKKLQMEINGVSTPIIVNNEMSIIKEERQENELSFPLKSTIESESKTQSPNDLSITLQSSTQTRIQEIPSKISLISKSNSLATAISKNQLTDVIQIQTKIKQESEQCVNNRKGDLPAENIVFQDKLLNSNISKNYKQCTKVLFEKSQQNCPFLLSPSELSTQDGTQSNPSTNQQPKVSLSLFKNSPSDL